MLLYFLIVHLPRCQGSEVI